MSYWTYKKFGRCISEKEINASINKNFSPWYLKPYYSFIEWNEKRKRYNSAEIKLKIDNPYNSFLIDFIITGLSILFVFSISVISIIIIKGCF